MLTFRRVVLVVFAATAIGGVAPSVAQAAGAYRAYVACRHSFTAPSSHSCRPANNEAAFFKSRDATVNYKICVRFPNGQRLCATQQHANKGDTVRNNITTSQVGQHHVKWYVHGELVRSWDFNVHN